MSIINENSSSFKYSGIVNIKKIDTKVNAVREEINIKNNGTSLLFKFLCNCLIGNLDQNILPKYLDATKQIPGITSENNAKDIITALTYRSRLSNTEVISEGNNYVAVFSAIITASQLLATEKIKGLVLYPTADITDTNRQLAVIDITNNGEGIELENSEILLVEWRLNFSN